ncbi:MAG: 4Fe-4S dicluster domain-containing protein [Chloroflexi bacterium]|nr:4Fe-4S dicluster domain-containing protein [Chloroflexota bacterium]MBV9896557.1 4Fe-4S dicluster domain-containing protein [Chloroflexota bacterium]
MASELRDLLDKKLLKECVHCGLCLDFCPTYRVLGHEADSPRGRIYQIRQVYEGKLSTDNADFREHIYACLDCRACQTACPSGVQYGAIIEAARAVAEPISPSEKTVGRAILGSVFTRPKLLDAAGVGLRLYQRSGAQLALRRSGLLKLLPQRLREMESMLAPAQGGIRRWSAPQVTPARGKVRYRVGFIEGCIMPQLFGDTNAATVRVLAANGCVVYSPPRQGCCGALQMHTGDRPTAQELARRNIDAFSGLGLDAIIINAAGCGSTLKEYGVLLRDDPTYAERAEQFAHQVKDVSEFLASIDLVKPTRSVPMTVTYQDACHLVHGQGIRNQPRQLLRQIPGLKLVEMKDSDVCCGSAGIYNLTHPDISVQLLEQKMDSVLATGASAVVAPNPGCTMQLAYGARRRGTTLQFFHVVDLLDRAYDG